MVLSTFWDFILNAVIKVSIEPRKKTALMTLNSNVAFVSPIRKHIHPYGSHEKIFSLHTSLEIPREHNGKTAKLDDD